tara:strand:- start:465 stop:1490 length:1026 start_codon:yes stop_codon:yes gene_type:complete
MDTIDIGLDLLANQNKTKQFNKTVTHVSSPPKHTSMSPISNVIHEEVDSLEDTTYKFKADEDININKQPVNQNYQYKPPTNNINVNNNIHNDMMSENSVQSNYDNIRPQQDYEEIMKEKYELLYKIESLKKKGIHIPGNVTIESNIEEIKYIYNKVVRDREKLTAVRFSRKMLMALCSGIEFLNTRFDPFDFKLDGWSESVHENVNDYDEVFEELHEKYKSKTKMIPELKLLFMLGGSAFMFHLTSAMFKNTSIPGVDNILKSNPELMKQFQSAALNSMNTQNTNPPRNFFNMNSNPMNFETPTQPKSTQQKEMAPPGVDDIIKELDLDDDTDIQNLLNGN